MTPRKDETEAQRLARNAYMREWTARRKASDPEWAEKERLRQNAKQLAKTRAMDPWDRQAMWRKNNLKRNFDMTPEQWQKMFDDQDGVCAICHQPEIKEGYRLATDHDHTCCPGKRSCGKCIRGLLCHNCNRGIGHLQESEEIMTNAIAYLKRPRT